MDQVDKQFIVSIFDGTVQRPEYLDFRPPAEYVQGLAINSREQAIEKGLDEKDLDSIAGIQGLPPYDVLKDMLENLRAIGKFPDLHGLGVELGAGLALFSIACIEKDVSQKITGIVALEAVKTFVDKGIQKVGAEILKERSVALLPCYGVFEKIPVKDETFDFAIQIESLHHAEDLDKAIREVSRVLRKGALVISLDRSWVNTVNPKTLQGMLDHEYSTEWLKAKKFPHDKRFTRRDNGEHEYRDCDWISTFERHSFKLVSTVHLHPNIQMWHLMKRVLGIFKLSKVFGIQVESRKGVLRSWLNQILKRQPRVHGNLLRSPHPRPFSFFVFEKEH